MEEKKDPKERILNEAAILIARKGFSAVGVREIAAKADVNIAMISYYYGGKIGILKAIIEFYFAELQQIVKEIAVLKLSAEDNARALIKRIVQLIRKNQDICRVAIFELPFEIPEIEDFKVQMLSQHIQLVKNIFQTAYPHSKESKQHIVIGPALLSLIFSNFFMGDIIHKLYDIDMNDEFYEFYSESIATIFLYGVVGIADKHRKAAHHPG